MLAVDKEIRRDRKQGALSGRLCACVLGVRRVRVNVVLCVYVSVQGVREKRV